jgi:hypothetical protein
MVSVVLISVVVLAIIKMQKDSKEMALYLSDRGKYEFDNTLFLGREVSKYHKERKDAYTLIRERFVVSDDRAQKVLKDKYRTISISEPFELGDELPIAVELKDIFLKDRYSARFLHFEVE